MTFDVLLSPPDVGELEQEYVLNAMKSGWVAPAGPDLASFEQEMADRLGVDHAVALSSGTAALHLALVSWGVGPGDVVPVSTFTFAASVNAIRYVGATPHLVDAEPEGGNIDVQLLASAMDVIEAQGGHLGAVLPVDLLGKCADNTAIAALCEARGVPLLCDSAESLGAAHSGRPAGSFGDASVLSFNGNKIMTTSGGGMLLTDDGRLAAHVRKLASQAREPTPYYQHTEVGYNYRLSNILAALGRAQLRRLDEMVARRRHWRKRYREVFAPIDGVRILGGADDAADNCWLTAVVVDPELTGWCVAELAAALEDASVETRPMWKPMHLQPFNEGLPSTLNGTSSAIYAQTLTLPSGSGMTEAEFGVVEAAIRMLVS